MGGVLNTVISLLIIVSVVIARPQNVQYQQPGQVVALPFYGGAKGQLLQITRDPSGAIISQTIVQENTNNIQDDRQSLNSQEASRNQDFSNHLFNIQSSAQRLVELQQKSKKSGQLKSDDQQVYATNLARLGEAATNLAMLGGQGSQDLSALFGTPKVLKKSEQNKKKENIREEDLEGQVVGEDEEDVGEETEGNEDQTSGNDGGDGVQINGPADSASVAEAKPVGVAIAGEGGVASSKPVATAVVGPGGLAIARPVATAIAGVDPNNVNLSGGKLPAARVRAPVQPAYQPVLQYLARPQYAISQEFHPPLAQLYPYQFVR